MGEIYDRLFGSRGGEPGFVNVPGEVIPGREAQIRATEEVPAPSLLERLFGGEETSISGRLFKQPSATEGAVDYLSGLAELTGRPRMAEAEALIESSGQGGPFQVYDPVVRSMASGMTGGFADELAAQAEASRKGTAYEDELTAQAAQTEAINPGLRYPLELAGGYLTGGNILKYGVGGAKTLGQKVMRGGLLSTGEGAIAGAGYAEPGKRTQGAVIGGGLSGLLGFAGPTVSGGAAAFGQRLSESGGRDIARRTISRLLNTIGFTPQQAAQAMRTKGQGTMLADVDEMLAIKGKEALSAPSKSRAGAMGAIKERADKSYDRVEAEFKKLFTDRDYDRTIKLIINTRKKNSDPLYKASVEDFGTVEMSGELEALLNLPPIKAAINQARKFNKDWVDLPDNDMRLIDKAYKNLGGRERVAYRQGNNVLGRDITNLRKELYDAVVPQNKKYGEALKEFESESALKDVAEKARKFMKEDPSKLKEWTDSISGSFSKREMANMGMIQGMLDKLGSKQTTYGEIKNFLRTPVVQERIKAVFPDLESYSKFMKTLDKEANFFETSTRSLGGGGSAKLSPSQIEELARSAGVDVALGMPGITTARTLRHLRSSKSMEGEIDEYLNILYKMTPDEIEKLPAMTGGKLPPRLQGSGLLTPATVPGVSVTTGLLGGS
jgi:hypothetical protein